MNDKARLLPVRIIGDDILRKKAQPITEFNNELQSFLRDLIFTMYQRDGVGLAANQVGSLQRVFVIDTQWSREDAVPMPIVMINPEIVSGEGEYEMEEGCISLPGVYAKVKRFHRIKYKYTDMEGKQQTGEAEGYDAVVIQHEYDHLNGVLFTDRLSKLSLLKVKRKLKALMSTAKNGVNVRTEIYGETDQKKDEFI
jgi:peptide deformylase